jgi:glycosyltransferase involved in cell wall biosynthesis
VDDGSIDDTSGILSSIHDARLAVLQNDQNCGLTASLNRALSVARAPYAARMDADDLSEPNRLERQVEYLETNLDVGLLGTATGRMDAQGRHLGLYPVYTRADGLRQRLLRENPFNHGSIVVRRELLEQIGGYRLAFRYAQDYDLILRLAEHCEVENLIEVLYWRRLSPEAISLQRGEQVGFASLARQLARERRTHGRELTSVERASREIRSGPPSRPRNASAGFLSYAKAMLSVRRYGACLYYLARSVIAWPANPAPWRWAVEVVAAKSRRLLRLRW